MQQYADIYSLQNYSTCFGCHSTHHQDIKNCTRCLRYGSNYLYRYSPPTWSDRDWFVRVAGGPLYERVWHENLELTKVLFRPYS